MIQEGWNYSGGQLFVAFTEDILSIRDFLLPRDPRVGDSWAGFPDNTYEVTNTDSITFGGQSYPCIKVRFDHLSGSTGVRKSGDYLQYEWALGLALYSWTERLRDYGGFIVADSNRRIRYTLIGITNEQHDKE